MQWYRCPLCLQDYKNPGQCPKCDTPLSLAAQKIPKNPTRLTPPPTRNYSILFLIPVVALLIFGIAWFFNASVDRAFTSPAPQPRVVVPPPPKIEVPPIPPFAFVEAPRTPPVPAADRCEICFGSGRAIYQAHADVNCSWCGNGGVQCGVCGGTGAGRDNLRCTQCCGSGRRCPIFAGKPCDACKGTGKKSPPRVPESSGAAGSGR
jgi:hypothetical protein